MTPEWVLKHQWSPDDRAWRWKQSCECSLCASETRSMAAQQAAGLSGMMQPNCVGQVTYDPIYGYRLPSR
jgi:hypothetical protein